jgi:hypothetical protein
MLKNQPAINTAQFIKKLKSYQSDEELAKYQRYFKFDKDNQRQDDYFIGVHMGQVFQLAKEFIEMVPAEIEILLESPIHEVRVGAVAILSGRGTSRTVSSLPKFCATMTTIWSRRQPAGCCAKPVKKSHSSYCIFWINMRLPCREQCCATRWNIWIKHSGSITGA